MAPYASMHRVKKQKAKWSTTVMMNARDLSRDDDFLSHLLVEHLGTDDSPLQVHKMDPSRRLPKHDPTEVLTIVKKYVVRRGGSSTSAHRVKRAVDALLELTAVKQYLHKRSTSQINAFATHASRYFELYLPTGSIEISHTSRYSHRTGKSELCILATTPLKVGQVISDLKGSLAHLTAEEDEELKKTDSRRRDGGIRRDFSVIHSNQKNKSHLFLGPARFVNHDCDHNVELFRDGRVITFRVIKPIAAGQEVTAHYGEGYFGKGNRHCLCQTCESLGRGGYTPEDEDSEQEVEDDSSTDEETREERIKAGLGLTAKGNPNERRTRRGVYAILPEEDTDDEDRVGATEAVAAQVPVQIVAKIEDEKMEMATARTTFEPPPSKSSSESSASSCPTVPEDVLIKNHDRRISDASSALTSLPDNDKSPSRLEDALTPPLSNALAQLISTSSLSSIDSVVSDTSSPRQAALTDARVPLTPATSRMSTRSATASQHKGKSKEESRSISVTPRVEEDKSVAVPDKRTSRTLRSGAVPAESGKEQTKETANAGQNPSARPIRKTRHSLPSFPKISDAGSSEPKSASSAQSKSATPVVGRSDKTHKKPRLDVPLCATCSGGLPHLSGMKKTKNVVHSCARCKRHMAIFGSAWPNRNGPLESLSSSESSSPETVFEDVHERLKSMTVYGHKFKYSRKYVEIKHPAIERPIKRRKTDSPLYLKTHHAVEQPRNGSGQFGSKNNSKNHGAYVHKTFTIPGGAQRSRAHRALSRERMRNTGSVDDSFKAKRRWGGGLPNGEHWAVGIQSRIRALKDGEDLSPKQFHAFGSRKTIRRVSSVPPFPAAKPLAALFARPSPNMFARHSWAVSNDGDGGAAADESVMETDSELTDLPDPEPKLAPSTPVVPAVSNAVKAGQKRKRESLPSDSKTKLGRRFYMKDEKKPMPKGWVLVTDSSEETGEDEEEDGVAQQDAPLAGDVPRSDPPGGSQVTQDMAISGNSGAFYSVTGTDSASASTPSLAHTPSSRAASTPTMSWTPAEDQSNITPVATKRPIITYSLRRSTASRTPSTVESKRRKIDSDANPSPRGKLQGARVDTYANGESKSEAPQRLADEFSEKEAPATDPTGIADVGATPDSTSTMQNDSIDMEVEMEDVSGFETATDKIAMLQASFTPRSERIAKGEQVAVAITGPEGSPHALFAAYGAQSLSGVVEVPDSESKRSALEVSNIIHGTAFSYGHPDARKTWKPTYHFSELDGWDSDVETCL